MNYLRGMAERKLKRYDEAEQSLRKEIECAGYVRAAVYRLGLLLDDRGKYSALERLYLEPEQRRHLPHQILRKLHWRHVRLGAYLKTLVLPIQKNWNVPGFLGAVLITVVWLYFLKRLDVFEPEKNRYLLLTLLGGMLTALATPFLYDMLEFYLGFDLSGRWPNDLLYCIFGIGLVEEFVKAVPFLLMIRISRQVNESVDFIIYAAVSALGFSFVENLLYFDESSLFIMNKRGMVCSIGHMFYTSLLGYGIILGRYRKKGTVVVNLLLFFLLACAFHGLYDFWLVCESIPDEFGGFSFLLAMIEVIIFNRMINNALNQSEFFEAKELERLNHLRERLGIFLVTIVMFEYLCLVWKYGPQLTYSQFAEVIGLTWFLILFLSFNLTHYIVRQGGWKPLFSRRRRHDAAG
ncbi:MAG: PrsW family intramembrane metalloprotease [Planctomycetota bacterium]